MNSILFGIVLLLSIIIVLMWGNARIDNRMDAFELSIINLRQIDQKIVDGINSIHPAPPVPSPPPPNEKVDEN